jgi:hypothetical protein
MFIMGLHNPYCKWDRCGIMGHNKTHDRITMGYNPFPPILNTTLETMLQ